LHFLTIPPPSTFIPKAGVKKRPKDASVSNPSLTDLIKFWPHFSSHSDYVEKIIPLAQELREKARTKASNQMKNVLTY
jgi:hypothetical protein